MADVTTIQIKRATKDALDKLRLSKRDTYNDIIEQLIEDSLELTEETLREIEEARVEVQQGKFVTLAQLKQDLGL